MRSQKGITLIALVITIIVMLILVAVTITMAVNGGLFEKAGEATKGTNDAMEAEKELAEGLVNVAGGDKDAPEEGSDVAGVVDHYVNVLTY